MEYFGRTTHREASAASETVSTSSDGAAAGRGASDVAVVIVDHGSRRQASNDMLEQFVEVYELYNGHEVVEAALMEIAEPTLLQVVAKCVERGAAFIVIAPYFLSRGRDIQSDIPAPVEEAQAVHPKVKTAVADPIGIDQVMVQLVENRVQAAINSYLWRSSRPRRSWVPSHRPRIGDCMRPIYVQSLLGATSVNVGLRQG